MEVWLLNHKAKKQSPLAAEETAPPGTNYSILCCPYCSRPLPAPPGAALLGFLSEARLPLPTHVALHVKTAATDTIK